MENIDWPSKKGLTTEQIRAELITLLDRARENNMNAVLLQVRPSCDALYQSDLEPWSEYLTGTMGRAPDNGFDPLAFAVDEAHKRGLELHAWFNPFRARMNYQSPAPGQPDPRPADPKHISRTHPEWVRTYGAMQWLDPGEKAARDYSLNVVLDVVKRYDVDGVHVDDYFYPYKINDPVTKQVVQFPDDGPYQKYKSEGGSLSKSDWRRANIDDYIQRMYQMVKAAKPHVKVGISPFGIWRPGNPAQIQGFDAYEELAGDAKKWLREGWGDYFTPQLYWPIAQTPQSFPVLLSWWLGENTQGRHLWPGLFTSRAFGADARWPQEEIEYQIRTTRGFAGAGGVIHFSAKYLLGGQASKSDSLAGRLRRTVYNDVALVPPSPWLTQAAPLASPAFKAVSTEQRSVTAFPLFRPQNSTFAEVNWFPVNGAWQYVVQWRIPATPGATAPSPNAAPRWKQAVVPAGSVDTPFRLPLVKGEPVPDAIAVTALDRAGVAGVPAVSVAR